MPWSPRDAIRHSHKATTRHLRRIWASVANDALRRGLDEGTAIREANAAVTYEIERRRVHLV